MYLAVFEIVGKMLVGLVYMQASAYHTLYRYIVRKLITGIVVSTVLKSKLALFQYVVSRFKSADTTRATVATGLCVLGGGGGGDDTPQ